MKIYSRYENGIEHCWFLSTNILYSQCYDKGDGKSLKMVFKGGRQYLYRGVGLEDYVLFRDSESTGEAANRYITKKYQAVRVEDVDVASLEEMRNRFMDEDRMINEKIGSLAYHMEANRSTGEFRLKLGDRTIYEGVEGKVSIVNLFSSMGVRYTASELETPLYTENDFITGKLLETNGQNDAVQTV